MVLWLSLEEGCIGIRAEQEQDLSSLSGVGPGKSSSCLVISQGTTLGGNGRS